MARFEGCDQKAGPRPGAYIGGFRSGTTLLINLLGLHPSVTAWFETKFLAEALRWMRVLNQPALCENELVLCAPPVPAGFNPEAVAARMQAQMEYDDARLGGRTSSGKRDYERYSLGPDRIHYSLQEALVELNNWRAAVLEGVSCGAVTYATAGLVMNLAARHLRIEPAPLLINKTPELPRFGRELRACLGPHKMILAVRDGREVVRSAAALGWASPERLTYLWRELILQSREAAQDAFNDYLEVRYEDLVTDPVKVIDEVCLFLEIPPLGVEIVHHYVVLAGIPIGSQEKAGVEFANQALNEVVVAEAGELLKDLRYLN